MAESTFVYLQGNGLPERFRTAAPAFTIGELGFGTGLNFLLSARAFLDQAPSGSMLFYFSVEKHPLPLHTLDCALAPFEELKQGRADLVRLLRDSSWRLPGFHTLFFHRRIRLTILHGEVGPMLSSLDGGFVDAWFPDGFAPAKNPAMWTDAVFSQMGRLSRPGTTVATFSAAGSVRRGLEAAGFRVAKVPGFGSKREMIQGLFTGNMQDDVLNSHVQDSENQELPSGGAQPAGTNGGRRAAIIGAGLSGITAAASLLHRGWAVDLYEKHAGPAEEGSGNPAGLFMPYLTAQPTPISRFTLRACETLLSAVRALGASDLIHKTGIVRLVDDDLEPRVNKAIHSHGLLRSWIRRVADRRYLVRQAGWAEPFNIAHRLIEQLGLLFPDKFRIHWQTELRDVPDAHITILASGTGLSSFPVASWLPLKPVRGQLFVAPLSMIQDLHGQKRPAVLETYLIASNTGLLVGATFEPFSSRKDRDPASDERLMAQLAEQFPDVHRALTGAMPGSTPAIFLPPAGRVAFRPQMKDYVPVVGPLPDREKALKRLAEEQKNGSARTEKSRTGKDLPSIPGLFVHGGGGSRGVMGSVLASELLAAWVGGEIFPVEADLAYSLLPHRFVLRESRTGKTPSA